MSHRPLLCCVLATIVCINLVAAQSAATACASAPKSGSVTVTPQRNAPSGYLVMLTISPVYGSFVSGCPGMAFWNSAVPNTPLAHWVAYCEPGATAYVWIKLPSATSGSAVNIDMWIGGCSITPVDVLASSGGFGDHFRSYANYSEAQGFWNLTAASSPLGWTCPGATAANYLVPATGHLRVFSHTVKSTDLNRFWQWSAPTQLPAGSYRLAAFLQSVNASSATRLAKSWPSLGAVATTALTSTTLNGANWVGASSAAALEFTSANIATAAVLKPHLQAKITSGGGCALCDCAMTPRIAFFVIQPLPGGVNEALPVINWAAPSPSPSPSRSASPTASPSRTASISTSKTSSASPSGTTTITPSRTPTPSASHAATSTPSQTHSITSSKSSSLTPGVSSSITPSLSAGPTGTASTSSAPSISSSLTAAPSTSLSPTAVPSVSITAGPSTSMSLTAAGTPSGSPMASLTVTSPATPAGTVSVSPSLGPTAAATMSRSPSTVATSSIASASRPGTAPPSLSPQPSSSATVSGTAAPTPSATVAPYLPDPACANCTLNVTAALDAVAAAGENADALRQITEATLGGGGLDVSDPAAAELIEQLSAAVGASLGSTSTSADAEDALNAAVLLVNAGAVGAAVVETYVDGLVSISIGLINETESAVLQSLVGVGTSLLASLASRTSTSAASEELVGAAELLSAAQARSGAIEVTVVGAVSVGGVSGSIAELTSGEQQIGGVAAVSMPADAQLTALQGEYTVAMVLWSNGSYPGNNQHNSTTTTAAAAARFVLTVSLLDASASRHSVSNLSSPVRISVPIPAGATASDIECASYDPAAAQWTTAGCSVDVAQSSATTAVCLCTHLTDFSVLVTTDGSPSDEGGGSGGSTFPTGAIVGIVVGSVSVLCACVIVVAVIVVVSIIAFKRRPKVLVLTGSSTNYDEGF